MSAPVGESSSYEAMKAEIRASLQVEVLADLPGSDRAFFIATLNKAWPIIAARVRAEAVAEERQRIVELVGDMCTSRKRDGRALPHPHPSDHLGPCPFGKVVWRILAATPEPERVDGLSWRVTCAVQMADGRPCGDVCYGRYAELAREEYDEHYERRHPVATPRPELPAGWYHRHGTDEESGRRFVYCEARGPVRAHCVRPRHGESEGTHQWAWFTVEDRTEAESAAAPSVGTETPAGAVSGGSGRTEPASDDELTRLRTFTVAVDQMLGDMDAAELRAEVHRLMETREEWLRQAATVWEPARFALLVNERDEAVAEVARCRAAIEKVLTAAEIWYRPAGESSADMIRRALPHLLRPGFPAGWETTRQAAEKVLGAVADLLDNPPAAALRDGAEPGKGEAGWMGPPDEFAQSGDGA